VISGLHDSDMKDHAITQAMLGKNLASVWVSRRGGGATRGAHSRGAQSTLLLLLSVGSAVTRGMGGGGRADREK
jgi:hypothetical protein